MMVGLYWAFGIFVTWSPAVLGLPDITPQWICATMNPDLGVSEQTRAHSPFAVTAKKSSEGNGIEVVIAATEGVTFERFFLQARDADDQDRILDGTFSTPNNTRTQSCPPYKNNTLFSNPSVRSNVTTSWTPAPGFIGNVFFTATVVKTENVFWTNVDSSSLFVYSTSMPYDFCGSQLGCFGMPKNCVGNKNCDLLLTYFPQDNGVTFQLMGTGNNSWVAVGLSDDDKMGNDSVTECLNTGTVQQSWNYPNYTNAVLIDTQEGINETIIYYVDGMIHCKWTRQNSTTIEKMLFDLQKEQFHLLLAQGLLDKNGTKQKHLHCIASEDKFSLTMVKIVDKSPSGAKANVGKLQLPVLVGLFTSAFYFSMQSRI